jgi:hypothetical protein
VTHFNGVESRLRQAANLPELLAAAFAAFEVLRKAARDHQNLAPGIFATFMTTADAAVDGREALTAAPSLPRTIKSEPEAALAAGADTHQAVDVLREIAIVLRDRLADAGALAVSPDDQIACHDAGEAADRICELMTRRGHASRPR